MMNTKCNPRLLGVVAVLSSKLLAQANADQYSWQEPGAEIFATGDLRWKPRPVPFRLAIRCVILIAIVATMEIWITPPRARGNIIRATRTQLGAPKNPKDGWIDSQDDAQVLQIAP
jgi:hypothetical protein